MDQTKLRHQLIDAIEIIGLKSKVIAEQTKILPCNLSKFKTGKIDLCIPEWYRLNNYLNSFNDFLEKTI